MNRRNEFRMGSAPASGAVFRALAENNGRAKTFGACWQFRAPQKLDARRVQLRPRRACSPIQIPILFESSNFAQRIWFIA